jgi:nitrous oxidase accessory protein NosD
MKLHTCILGIVTVVALFGFQSSTFAAVGGPVCFVPVDYPTIQAAVNDAGCTTINVAAGTYTEHVAVNRAVILNGANMGVVGNGVRGAESIVDGTDTGAPFAITANNVTIDGFKIINGSNGGLDSGIWSQTGTQNSSIKNNIITANDFGVWAQCGAACSIANNLFDGNNKPGSGSGSASISADNTTGLTKRAMNSRTILPEIPYYCKLSAQEHIPMRLSRTTIFTTTPIPTCTFSV